MAIKRIIIKDCHGNTIGTDDLAIVGSVTVKVDGGYGEPSASASYNNQVLTLMFHNIKGNGVASMSQIYESAESGGENVFKITDDEGNAAFFKVRNGAKGDTVILGDQEYTLYNLAGNSTVGAMTQSAVTERITAEESVVDLTSLPFENVYISSDTKVYKVVSGGSSGGVFIPVTPGKVMKVVSHDGWTVHLAFVTSNSYTNNAQPAWAHESDRVPIDGGTTWIGEVPHDASYLYLYTKSGGNDRTPDKVAVCEFIKDEMESLFAGQKELRTDLDNERMITTPIDLLQYESIYYYISASGDNLRWVNNINYQSKLVAVHPGDKVMLAKRADGGNLLWAFLTNNSHSSGTTPAFAGDGTLNYKTTTTPVVYTAPDDAAFLYLCVTLDGTDRTPGVCSLVDSSHDTVVAAHDALRQHLMPVDISEEIEHSHFNSDGSISEYSPDSANYNKVILRRYAITPGKTYYGSARLGAGAIYNGAYYYNSNGGCIGTDINFAPTGELRLIKDQMLTVPDGASSVVLQGFKAESTPDPWVPDLKVGSWANREDVSPLLIEFHESLVRLNVYNSHSDETGSTSTEIVDEMVSSPWAVMWPTSYTPFGKPTQVIAMLHGATGFVGTYTSGSNIVKVMGYTLDGWTKWRAMYIQAGYAVMDINGVGSHDGSRTAGNNSKHYGCPTAVETLDKAFEYLRLHYNIADKLLIHGASMGGALAQSYALAYPGKVLAVGLFASVMAMRTIVALESAAANAVCQLWGYDSTSTARDDSWRKMVGTPFCKCLVWNPDGSITGVSWSDIYTSGKSKEGDASDDEKITEEIYDHDFIEHFPVPVRCWHGTSDSDVDWRINRHVIDSYRRGNSNATLRLVSGANHNDVVVGGVAYLMSEALAFFKRYGG